MTENNNKQEEIYKEIPLDLIKVDFNIRSKPEDDKIIELAESIKKYGVLQPIRVYEKDSFYYIIYGHRRCLAAKKAGLIHIKAVIVTEPEAIDKIYMKVIENEQNKSMSPEDQETCIHFLVENKESINKIANTIGKSPSWVRECNIAFIERKKNITRFDNNGIKFSTKDMYALRNATEEQVMDAVALVCENPDNKLNILENLNKKTKKKMNVGGKRKNKNNAISGNINIAFCINFDEEEKTVSIQTKKDESIDEILAKLLMEEIVNFYTQKGYTSL